LDSHNPSRGQNRRRFVESLARIILAPELSCKRHRALGWLRPLSFFARFCERTIMSVNSIRNWFRRPARPSPLRRRLRLESLEIRANPSSTILVDDDGQQFPNADFETIQEAVDAAESGDRIFVATGDYQEQVVIGDDKDNLSIRAVGHANIIAPEVFGDPSNAIVHIDGADGVKLAGFAIRGDGFATGPNFGILVDGDGSASLSLNRISGIRDEPLSGRQEGVAIQFGQLTDGGPGSGSASLNHISDYQKGGIVVIGEGSSASISFNKIRGVGETDVIAQNGIQISDGAEAHVDFNAVSGNQYTGADFESVGILIFDTANVRVRGNTTFNNDEGILLFGDLVEVSDVTVELNLAFNNTFNGIGLFNVTDSTVRANVAKNNGFDGINLEASSDNQVFLNFASSNGRHGIALEEDTEDNVISFNKMFDNEEFDAFDASTGSGTAGTANIWRFNRFDTSNPEGLR
jgi:parallel beta-helix repeat protein